METILTGTVHTPNASPGDGSGRPGYRPQGPQADALALRQLIATASHAGQGRRLRCRRIRGTAVPPGGAGVSEQGQCSHLVEQSADAAERGRRLPRQAGSGRIAFGERQLAQAELRLRLDQPFTGITGEFQGAAQRAAGRRLLTEPCSRDTEALQDVSLPEGPRGPG